MNSIFPPNPKNGTVVEAQNGFFFRYDAVIQSWIKIATTGLTIPLVDLSNPGAMSSSDLYQLLLVPIVCRHFKPAL